MRSYQIKIIIVIFLLVVNLIIYSKLLASFGLIKSNVLGLSTIWSFNFPSSALKPVIEKRLEDQEGKYAVVVHRLYDDIEEFSLNKHEVFHSASLYKLFLLAAIMEEIEQGRLKENQVVVAKKSHLEKVFGGVDFGYEEVGEDISYSVAEVLTRIATISDNFASIAIAEKIGWGKVQAQADKLGATATIIKNPIQTSAEDITRFYRKLYLGEVVSKGASDKIIDLLSKSKINDRIPSKLPKEVKVAHKTAELSRIRHDAGIVYLEGQPYIIVLMSQDLKYEDSAVGTLADISKDVYDYFVSNKK